MGTFARNNNGDTIQAFPINEHTEEGTFTDKSVTNLDTIRLLIDGNLTFAMRSGASIVVAGLVGEDFAITEDVISFTSTAAVRVA